jgi:hypothetical protein
MGSPNSLLTSFNELISNTSFQGFSALISLIAAITSDNLWVRIPALFVLFSLLLALRSVVFPWIRGACIWLTWKFVLGFAVGLITVAILAPLLEPFYKFSISLILPQVEVLDSSPQDAGKLSELSGVLTVNFSQTIPSKFFGLVKVEVTPYTPLKKTWIYISDPRECCRTLYIKPDKYYPNENLPRFEPNKIYHLQVSGLLLKNPVVIKFRTPPQ